MTISEYLACLFMDTLMGLFIHFIMYLHISLFTKFYTICFLLCLCFHKIHVEVRQEAVQQALAAMQNRPKPSLPMPSKRTSVMARSPDREHQDSGKIIHLHLLSPRGISLGIE